ncbi:cytochrome c nitrite reductase pentaheme subunit [Phycisphaerae bacterium RAS1]|nr:cytochrome c nitrite reductase pentaheme subunit [Phycisphaerae bacterium RAS1]
MLDRRIFGLAAALLAAGLAPSVAQPVGAYIGVVERTFSAATDPPMRFPTGVSVANDGTVYVADGVNDRVLIFSADAALTADIREVGGTPLHSPVGVRSAGAGDLWIADTGNRRVVLRGKDGGLLRELRVPQAEGGPAGDPTDVAVAPGGNAIWIADNEASRLLRHNLTDGTWTSVGEMGATAGQLQHPFMLAVNRTGDVFTSDVLNARVQLFSPAGQAAGILGGYGVEPGQLYRPKGVAVDPKGNLWVADSVLGVIQIFTPNGGCLGVVSSAAGGPLRFESPTGIALSTDGDVLYVTELAAHRVSAVRITPPELAPVPVASKGAISGSGRQARDCTVCHLEWLPPFSEARDSALMPRPPADPDEPFVARAQVCLSCHDASIVDSRRKVWLEHGHRTGVTPPESIKVPSKLPLVRGQLACRTCHSAHVFGEPQGDIRTAVFLRVRNTAGELCMSCHVDKTQGPRFGTHPTGGMPWAVPQALVDAGARLGPNARELTCQVCHMAHGSRNDHLLVLGTQGNQLCLSCHDQIRPGMFRDGPHTEHPFTARVSPRQAAVIESMGTRTGPDGQLICLTCHKLHHGRGERYLLAQDLKEGQMCLSCHEERRTLLGSPHDLRLSSPEERNRLGMTASSGGPCSTCHLFHRYAREITPTTIDPSGQCVTCHGAGRCANARALGDVNHPQLRCVVCHNPHDPQFGRFLNDAPRRLCTSCHADARFADGDPSEPAAQATKAATGASHPFNAALSVGQRDVLSNLGSLLSSDGRIDCVSCHALHRSKSSDSLLAASTATGELCLNCHSQNQTIFGSSHDIRSTCPQHALRPGQSAADSGPCSGCHGIHEPRQSTAQKCQTCHQQGDCGESRTLGDVNHPAVPCTACHAPHDEANGSFLADAPARVCSSCHTEKRNIAHTGHAPATMARHGFETDACQPCHNVHGNHDNTQPELLWPRQLASYASLVASLDVASSPTADRLCVECHCSGADPPGLPPIWSHPDVPMFEVGGGLPLFDAAGRRSPNGTITCRTCHQPHGRDAADLPASAPVQRAARLMLRAFTTPNACTACHGEEGLHRFLYFHDPERRGGAAVWSSR